VRARPLDPTLCVTVTETERPLPVESPPRVVVVHVRVVSDVHEVLSHTYAAGWIAAVGQ